MESTRTDVAGRLLNITVLVASLGYFIDMFDLFICNLVRVKSLGSMGLTGMDLTHAGLIVSNCQLAGVVLGGYLSGLIGDKWGRKASLFLSIIVYSLGSLACALVTGVPAYGIARFFAGLGLAGELGAGVVIIAEKMRGDRRGMGVMVFISMGFAGVLCAALVSELVYWRTAYIIGGLFGLGILLTRALLSESGLFEKMERQATLVRGGLRLILRDRKLLKKYLGALFIMVPGVFAPQIMWTLAPELSKAAGVIDPVKVSIVSAAGFGFGIICDFVSMYLSEKLRSRRRAVTTFLIVFASSLFVYVVFPSPVLAVFYGLSAFLGASMGMWVIGAVWAAESFGTNIRATATTTIPSLARGSAILMNIAYGQLKFINPLMAAGVIGLVVVVLAAIGVRLLPETYGRDLDFVEERSA